jgi:hypothetical protein
VYIIFVERSWHMNATQVQTGYQPVHQKEISVRNMAGITLMESIGAIATIALTIAGLTGVYSMTLAAIAMIVLGAAIWIEGGAFVATHTTEVSGESTGARVLRLSEGLEAEFLGGVSGIVLGILALLGVVPMTLLSIGVLVFGASFLFSSRTWLSSGSQLMFGLAGSTLGLLAVCGLSPLTLVLVGLMCLGASALFNGAVLSARMAMAPRT